MNKFAKKLIKKTTKSLNKKIKHIGLIKRNYAIEAKAVRFNEWGNPQRVLKYETVKVNDELKEGQVLLQMKAAPINPSDINIVQGTYGSTVNPPATGGSEGVGIVQKVGPGVSNVQVNDRVVTASDGLGTWTSHLVVKSDNVFKVSDNIPLEYAASLSINPVTALQLLEQFETLQSGDTIIQNGANSMVGLSVMQLAAARGIKTINVIRDRPDHEEVVERLKQYGGYIVITDSYLRSRGYDQLVADLPKPKLALNGIGGYSATEIARKLANGGTFVTYGAMSNKPIQFPSSLFISKNITAKGFWLKHWVQNASYQQKQQTFDQVQQFIEQKQLRLWFEYHNLSSFNWALDRYFEPFKDRKVVLHLDK